MITKEDNKLIQIKKRGKRKQATHIIYYKVAGGETERKLKSLCDSASPLKLSFLDVP